MYGEAIFNKWNIFASGYRIFAYRIDTHTMKHQTKIPQKDWIAVAAITTAITINAYEEHASAYIKMLHTVK